jgi:crotonobetainyl-CoA:carnitine CoA-transferase CaiB-like acyl-CoA transferase
MCRSEAFCDARSALKEREAWAYRFDARGVMVAGVVAMKKSLGSKIALALVFTTTVAGSLCAPLASAHAQVVVVEPPAPQEEVVPPVPYEGAVWAPGYYEWRGRRHVWVGGRYMHGRAGYAWRPHAWAHEGGGWRMHRGGWERHR